MPSTVASLCRTAGGRTMPRLTILAVLLLGLLAPFPANAIPVLLQVSGYVAMPASERDSSTAQHGAATAQHWCNDNGASLIADSRGEITHTIQRLCATDGKALCTTFLDGNAKPRDDYTNGCVENQPDSTLTPNSMLCTYRWRFGFYDTFAETYGDNGMIQDVNGYQPGTCYFKGLYIDLRGYTGYSQFCNGFILEQVWNSSSALYRLGYPHGKFQIIAGTTSSRYYRMDTDLVAVNNVPNPLSSYTIYCYLQDYPLPAPWTEKPSQPNVIKGYKDLTWAQEHWWVIFLIVAVVIVAVLLFIIIYCAVTSKPVKEEPFLPMMVQREREGKRYVYIEDEEQAEKNDDTADRGGNMMPAPMPPPEQNQDALYPGETPQQRAMRLGKGFTFANPADDERGRAAIYTNGDLAQHSENASLADDDDQKEALDALSARQLAASPRMKQPEPEPPAPKQEAEVPLPAAQEPQPAAQSPTADALREEMVSLVDNEPGGDSQLPSIKSRRSARRGRGRTSSQTFSEIEVPQGDEINEMNIEL